MKTTSQESQRGTPRPKINHNHEKKCADAIHSLVAVGAAPSGVKHVLRQRGAKSCGLSAPKEQTNKQFQTPKEIGTGGLHPLNPSVPQYGGRARRSGAKPCAPAISHQKKHATSDNEEDKRPFLLVRE